MLSFVLDQRATNFYYNIFTKVSVGVQIQKAAANRHAENLLKHHKSQQFDFVVYTDAGASSADAASSASDTAPPAPDDASEWLSRDAPPEGIFAEDSADDSWDDVPDDVNEGAGWGGSNDGGGSWFDVFGDGE